MTGFVPNVPLRCGDVLTHASVFVGESAPFDLLLGRPWQRGNFVSIDERVDGTYLLFKDRSMNVRYEILVTPELAPSYDPAITDYLSRVGDLANYMVSTATLPTEPKKVGPTDYIKQAEDKQENEADALQALIKKLEDMYTKQQMNAEGTLGSEYPTAKTPDKVQLETLSQPPNSPVREGNDAEEPMIIAEDYTTGIEEMLQEWEAQQEAKRDPPSHEESMYYEGTISPGYEADSEISQVLSAHATRAEDRPRTGGGQEERPDSGYLILSGDPNEPGTEYNRFMSASRYWPEGYDVTVAGPYTYLKYPGAQARALPDLVIPTPMPPLPTAPPPLSDDEHRSAQQEPISNRNDRSTSDDHVPESIEGFAGPSSSEMLLEDETAARESDNSVARTPAIEEMNGLTCLGNCPGCGGFGHGIFVCPAFRALERAGVLERDDATGLLVIPQENVLAERPRRMKKKRRLTWEVGEGLRLGEPPPRA